MQNILGFAFFTQIQKFADLMNYPLPKIIDKHYYKPLKTQQRLVTAIIII